VQFAAMLQIFVRKNKKPKGQKNFLNKIRLFSKKHLIFFKRCGIIYESPHLTECGKRQNNGEVA